MKEAQASETPNNRSQPKRKTKRKEEGNAAGTQASTQKKQKPVQGQEPKSKGEGPAARTRRPPEPTVCHQNILSILDT